MIKKCSVCGNIWAGNRNDLCPQCGISAYGKLDLSEEIDNLITAAEKGDAEAQYKLGVNAIYAERGWASPWNSDPSGPSWHYDFYKNDEAIGWFLRAAEQGHAAAQYELGMAYYEGDGINFDYNEAFKWLSKAAEQGHIAAQMKLGSCYENGYGIEKDCKEAFKRYQKAADADYTPSEIELARCYEEGIGVERNFKEAFKLYKDAAEKGNDAAGYEVGRCYEEGIGVQKNVYEAWWWYHSSCFGNESASDALEELDLGDCFVDIDLYELHEIFEAADGGDVDCQYDLAYWFEHSVLDGYYEEDGEEDEFEAVDLDNAKYWYKKAAEQGHEKAQAALGRLKNEE